MAAQDAQHTAGSREHTSLSFIEGGTWRDGGGALWGKEGSSLSKDSVLLAIAMGGCCSGQRVWLGTLLHSKGTHKMMLVLLILDVVCVVAGLILEIAYLDSVVRGLEDVLEEAIVLYDHNRSYFEHHHNAHAIVHHSGNHDLHAAERGFAWASVGVLRRVPSRLAGAPPPWLARQPVSCAGSYAGVWLRCWQAGSTKERCIACSRTLPLASSYWKGSGSSL